MKKHTIATFAFAACAAFSAFTQAEAADGNIYTISPDTKSSGTTDYYDAGQSFRFRVRLLSSTYATPTPGVWTRKHVGYDAEVLDDVYNPPMLGVVVSGQLREAKIVDIEYGTTATVGVHPYTDLICEYTVRPGDVALPARLALKDGNGWQAAGDRDSNGVEYFLFNADKWQFQDANGDACQFYYCSSATAGAAYAQWGAKSEIGKQTDHLDYDLTKADFKVKAVDFDGNKDSADYWRIVKAGTTETTYRPTIETSGTPEESTFLYVWSENEDSVVVSGDAQPLEITLEDGSKVTKQVKTIKVVTGETSYPIEIRGKTQGTHTRLVLSPTKGYIFDAAGHTVENFLTAKVYCSEPPSPNIQLSFDPAYPTSAKTKTVDTSMRTTETLAEDAVPVYVTLSEAYATDVTVKIAVTNVGNVACDPITNRNIAVSSDGESFSSTDVAYTNFTIRAGVKEAVFYVYPLGGDAQTQAQGISFTPSIAEAAAAAHYEVGARALLKIKGIHRPTVSSSAEGSDDPQDATGFSVPLLVEDCYRDLMNPKGFKVEVDYSDGSKMSPTNVVFTEGAETQVFLKDYGVNARYANIRVTEPDGTAYGSVKISFSVKPQKTIVASLYDSTEENSLHAGTVFAEGAAPLVRFTLSEKMSVGTDRYAFLVPQNPASSNLVECAAFTEGILIPGGLTNSTLNAKFTLKLKDGCAACDGTDGLLSYRIVLRTANTLTEGEADGSYTDVAGLQFTVSNVPPEIKGVYVSGNPTSVKNGAHYKDPVACETDIEFGYKTAEVSAIDQADGLVTIWCFSEGRTSGAWKYTAVVTNATTALCTHQFTYPGVTQQVQVVALDKDLVYALTNGTGRIDFTKETDLKTIWPRIADYVEPFAFTVGVSTKPHIVVEPTGFVEMANGLTMDETGNNKTAKLRVSLSSSASERTKLRIIAKPAADADPGTLEFDTETKPVDPTDPSAGVYTELFVEQDQVEPARSSSYILNQGLKFKYVTLNGTSGSEDAGWEIIVEAQKEDAEGKWVADPYYAKSEGTMLTVINLAPTISPAQPRPGDAIVTNKNQTIGKPFSITWTPGDVAADAGPSARWPNGEKGLKCEWYINDIYQSGKTTYVTNQTGKLTAAVQTTELTLSSEGVSVIRLVITDLDGEDYHGKTEREWLYYISPTKKLVVMPVGPGRGQTTKYNNRAGTGKGRVYADGGGVAVAAFAQTWSYNVTAREATAFAYGYPSKAEKYYDNGTLGPGSRDVAIDPYGDSRNPGYLANTYYPVDGLFDNYFYRWVYVIPNETGGASTYEYGNLNPTATADTPTTETVVLDEYEEDKESYLARRLEAVFSRELLASDNLGDINADYIPDIYVARMPDFGVCDDSQATVGDDFADLERFNGDADFLPNTMTAAYASFVPGISNTWATAGRAFTARMELRGVDDNFNDATAGAFVDGVPNRVAIIDAKPDKSYTDPTADAKSTLSFLEYVAFTNWCGRQAAPLDPTVKANWAKWSPERPTDPTKIDTDEDGLSDGYEYYFWYKAHVGYFETDGDPTTYKRLVGRRYNPANPCEPTVIDADRIESLFDPVVRGQDFDEVDTDNDGLIDRIEFEIGTNPIDYDSDGDGLPDGYELAISQTDPLRYSTNGGISDRDLNPDGDQMAAMELNMVPVYVAFTNAVPGDLEASLKITNTYWVGEKDFEALLEVREEIEDAGYARLRTAVSFYHAWLYDTASDPVRWALGLPVYDDDAKSLDENLVILGFPLEAVKVLALHYQLRWFKGYDPRTGWNVPGIPEPPPRRVDTAIYTNWDEFQSLAFFCQMGGLTDADVTPTRERPWEQIWASSATSPLTADTDEDGMPDGWEFYVMRNDGWQGNAGPGNIYGPLYDFGKVVGLARDPEINPAEPVIGDGLDFLQEWMGTETMSRYLDCETIAKGLEGWTWKNKLWPTDPWNPDTDGDGIKDGEERVWIFGDTPANPLGFVDGGGLNPLSWDTDADGLPDPWELEFAGTVGAPPAGGDAAATNDTATAVADATDTGDDASTNATAAATVATGDGRVFLKDGMNPTFADAYDDYDHDGLLNWQEYMVGSMRHFRYDDTASQWGTEFDAQFDPDTGDLIVPDPANAEEWGSFWYSIFVDPVYAPMAGDPTRLFEAADVTSRKFNSHMAMGEGKFDAGMAYFSACTNSWDYNAVNRYYMFRDGVYHDLKDIPAGMYMAEDGRQFNRFLYKLRVNPYAQQLNYFYPPPESHVIYPKTYICCDPTIADSDGDGLDDYYEIFHGLNPLLGASGQTAGVGKDGKGRKFTSPRDIVYQAYALQGAPSAEMNWWMFAEGADHLEKAVNPNTGGRWLQDGSVGTYDFVNFPWLAGLPAADPDGDDARNYEESIQANLQAVSTYFHTDPTPLWMTDTAYGDSFTARYYFPMLRKGTVIPNVTQDYFTYTNPYPVMNEEGQLDFDTVVTRHFSEFPGVTYDAENQRLIVIYTGLDNWGLTGAQFDYEENEGYDSDHDFLSDTAERTGITKSASDPQDHDSPVRRQAMWFGGNLEAGGENGPGFLETPIPVAEMTSSDEGGAENRESFEFFTAECWAKADADTYDKEGYQIVLERSVYTGDAGPADSEYVRKNFIIGIRNGRWFAGFDSAGTALDRIEITDGPVATTNWTYLAATYEGTALTLYVGENDDFQAFSKPVGRHPEHGVIAPIITPDGELIGADDPVYGSAVGSPCVAVMVGASIKTMYGHAFDYHFIDHWTNIDDYGDFYRGYVDEVRLWDGARTAKELEADFRARIRYTAATADANRKAVYEKWITGATRAENNVAGTLPPELRYHWAFDHIAGAVDPLAVMKTPAGYQASGDLTDAKAYWCRPPEWIDPWRAGFHTTLMSSVYDDLSYVPWINDTVSHLPRFDGTTVDSCYWTENSVGNLSANSLGYAKFGFNRTHEVWSKWLQMGYVQPPPVTTPTRWENLKQALAEDDEIRRRVRFTMRNACTYGNDMLPFGSAYPKRISLFDDGLWDECGAADAWAQTGTDLDRGNPDPDNDGLPSWWEDIAYNEYDAQVEPGEVEVNWTTIVTYDGVEMEAGQAYLRDLARGMLPDGKYHPEYVDARDSDKDGVIDFYAEAYNLMDGHAGDDDDGDGLSNYAEYLITEVFRFAKCDPKQYATDRKTCDYFLKVGDLYLGEIFTDHDQMDDIWEAQFDVDSINRYVYDPLDDADGDGWSNYAEFRANTNPAKTDALSIDGYVRPEYPVPTLAANVICHASTVIRAPLVFKAWNEQTDAAMVKAPDAVWTLGETETEEGNEETGTDDGLTERDKFLGRKPTGEYTFYLPGGNVSEGSFKLAFTDKDYVVVDHDPATGLNTPVGPGDPDKAVWYYVVVDRGGKLIRAGGSYAALAGYAETEFGTIDYESGKVTVDFSHEELCGQQLTAAPADDDDATDDDGENRYHYVDFDNSYVAASWKASTALLTGPGLHYLSDPDEQSDSSVSFGHLREGKNTFVCFEDTDGNGEYTPGELFGVVRGVDVGWSGAAFDIELTPTHPIFARVDISSGSNDRATWYGIDSGNLPIANAIENASSDDDTQTLLELLTGGGDTEGETLNNGGRTMHVRVDRYAVNGVPIGTDAATQILIKYNRVLLDKWLTAGVRTYIHEGDFLSDDEFDIDWKNFSEIADDPAVQLNFGGKVQSVSYRVVIDNADFVHPAASNRVLSVAFTRSFDAEHKTATLLEPEGVVYGARPTFRWSMNGFNSYTAFKLRIYARTADNRVGSLVYESPMTRVPACDENGNYVWKASFSVGDQTSVGKVLGQAGNFWWTVSMYNAKYQEDLFAPERAFSTAVNQQQYADDHGYGAIDVAVKYAGPVGVLADATDLASAKGIVRIQAFARPDFAGVPESQSFATNVTAIADTTTVAANARLCGLKAGTYFVRAYIDVNGNFKKDDWEPWGGMTEAVTVAPAKVPDTAVVWIEDADTDGDWLPDAWEWKEYKGNLDHLNDALPRVDAAGRIVLKTETFTVVTNGRASISKSLPGASLTLFENLTAAVRLLKLGSPITTDTIDSIRLAVARSIDPRTVLVKDLRLNAAARMVTMSVGANVTEPTAWSPLSAIYSVPDVSVVTVTVERADAPGDEWEPVATQQVMVNAALEATFEIPIEENVNGGIYRVTVAQ